jgi:hypothetical protein
MSGERTENPKSALQSPWGVSEGARNSFLELVTSYSPHLAPAHFGPDFGAKVRDLNGARSEPNEISGRNDLIRSLIQSIIAVRLEKFGSLTIF